MKLFNTLILTTMLFLSFNAHAVKDTNETDANTLVKTSKLPVVIEIYATWCEPCKLLSPMMEQAEKDFKDKAVFIKIDLDKTEQIQKIVHSIPFIVVTKDGGKPVSAVTGAPDTLKQLEDFIQKALNKKAKK